MPSYGLILEGEGDQRVFDSLIRRINSPNADIYPRICGGVGRLMKKFPALLKEFEHIHCGGPVDGAVVIRDADNKRVEDVLSLMKSKLHNRLYSFPREVEMCCVNRTLDTWLLADETAINAVSQSRGGKPVPRVNETLEDIFDPKERLRKVLSHARLTYSPAVLGEIASHINLEQLEHRAPSFRSFRQCVLRIWGR